MTDTHGTGNHHRDLLAPKISEQELARIATSFELTGNLLKQAGSRTEQATADWKRGLRSPNLEPTRSDRYEEVEDSEGTFSARVPADTTGEAALTDDKLDLSNQRFLHLIRIADKTATELRNLIYSACPQITQPDTFEPDTPAQVSLAGWCVSCWRDNRYLEPVSMRPDGTRRYRDYCTWCGEYVADAKKRQLAAVRNEPKKKRRKAKQQEQRPDPVPPLELVERRHRGERITQQMVELAEGRRKAS